MNILLLFPFSSLIVELRVHAVSVSATVVVWDVWRAESEAKQGRATCWRHRASLKVLIHIFLKKRVSELKLSITTVLEVGILRGQAPNTDKLRQWQESKPHL